MSHELCESPNQAIVLTVAIVLGLGVFFALLSLRSKQRGKMLLFAGIIIAVGLAIGSGTLHKDPHFINWSSDGGNVTLGYAWPASSVTLPATQIRDVRAAHGVLRHQRRNGSPEVRDVVWLEVVAGEKYESCRAGGDRVVESARELASAAHVTPAFSIRCENGRDVSSSPDEVARGGSRWEAELAPRCK
jgi:hypothetical protein